jgi:hypothetical protein
MSIDTREAVAVEVQDDYVARIGKGKTTPELGLIYHNFQEYKTMLQKADWFYQASEDSNVYKQGKNQFYMIGLYQRAIDPDRKLFNAYRPKDPMAAMPIYIKE